MSLNLETLFFQLRANLASSVDSTDYGGSLTFLHSEKPSDASILFHNTYTITSATDLDLDLSGSLTTGLGTTVNFTKIYMIAIVNLSTSSGQNVILGGGGNFHSWAGAQSHEVKIGPKGLFILNSPVDGYTVTNSSADILRLRNTGLTSVQTRIALIGK